MPKIPPDELLSVFVLYLINVSQPTTEDKLVNGLRSSPRFLGSDEGTIFEKVRAALASLQGRGYTRAGADGMYNVTYSGIQFLTEKRMAFPRDKNRLYFLKEVLRRRG